jgi:hypothetical protein
MAILPRVDGITLERASREYRRDSIAQLYTAFRAAPDRKTVMGEARADLPRGRIDLMVRNIEGLFNSMDPSPFIRASTILQFAACSEISPPEVLASIG